jgi:hypothetical protein
MNKLVFCIIILVILPGCGSPTTSDTLMTPTVALRTVAIASPTATVSPTCIPTPITNEVVYPVYQVIDAKNIDKLTLLHVWDVDRISPFAKEITWI